jgi:hypothetical protein
MAKRTVSPTRTATDALAVLGAQIRMALRRNIAVNSERFAIRASIAGL